MSRPPACILVVEDDADTRAALVAALEELPVEVLTAADGAEGLRTAKSHSPDLILLDLGLPRMSGIGIAQELKGDPRTASIPVIAVSGLLRLNDADAVRALQVDEYVAKPFVVDDLVALVQAWLGRRSKIRRPRLPG